MQRRSLTCSACTGPEVLPLPSVSPRRSHRTAASAGASDVRELDLCDCERALGTPHGLTCEKQGYFVTGFENEGSWVRASIISTRYFMPAASNAPALSRLNRSARCDQSCNEAGSVAVQRHQ